jgi:hypothetical protein
MLCCRVVPADLLAHDLHGACKSKLHRSEWACLPYYRSPHSTDRKTFPLPITTEIMPCILPRGLRVSEGATSTLRNGNPARQPLRTNFVDTAQMASVSPCTANGQHTQDTRNAAANANAPKRVYDASSRRGTSLPTGQPPSLTKVKTVRRGVPDSMNPLGSLLRFRKLRSSTGTGLWQTHQSSSSRSSLEGMINDIGATDRAWTWLTWLLIVGVGDSKGLKKQNLNRST